jgi:hypothetical protein
MGQGILLTREQYRTLVEVRKIPSDYDDSILDAEELFEM